MSMAFGVSSDDVLLVAHRSGLNITDELAQEWFDELDHGAVEKSALYGQDMDQQTDYALDEIQRQLESLGHISAQQKPRSQKP